MLDVSADQGKFTRCIRLVIADRQPIVLQGLRSVFAAQHDFEIVASCSRGTSCLEAIRNLAPDVALLASTLPDVTVSEILAIAKAESLPTQLVFFAESEGDDDLTAAIAAGACSAISKYANPDTMLRSLRMMTERVGASSERSQDFQPNGKEADAAKIERMLGLLTHRESQIVRLVSEGLSNKEIARQLNVSHGTIKVHLHNIFQKLEISNRTVLATIALLQRPAGFGMLSLVALAFAILNDVKAAEANTTFLDDDSTADKDLGHPVFELWKKAILRHVILVDPVETGVLTQRGFSTKESPATHSAARIEGLPAAGQVVLSSVGRGYGPIGSSTPSLFISPLLQAINNSQAGNPTAPPQLPPLEIASNPIKNLGGYGTFAMTAAGVLIYALDNSHAAVQALDPGATLIDTSTVATLDAATQAATITIHGASKADPNEVDNLASGPVVHDSHPQLAFGALGHESVTGEGNAGQMVHVGAGDDILNGAGLADVIDGGAANDTIKGSGRDGAIHAEPVGDNTSGTIIGGFGGDQLTGSKGDDTFVYRSANDSNSSKFDTDFTPGEDRINLAAFGALAFLHMTSTSASVPPHTLAWIYNSVSNETIVYVNPTDRSLHIGDPGLLEIHLQGVVSVAESDFVYEREAAGVAAALKGIDPALLLATASDGTILTSSSADSAEDRTSESTLGTTGFWTMPADDGLRLHLARDRVGSIISTRLASSGNDSAYAMEESDVGAVSVPALVSTIEPAYSHATVLTEENFIFKKAPVHANTGAVATGHGNAHLAAGIGLFEFDVQSVAIVAPAAVAEPVETGVAAGSSAGRGNSQHASHSISAKASETTELAEPGTVPGNGVGHGNAQHASNAAAVKASAAAELAEPGIMPGSGVGHGNALHVSNAAAAKASAAAELAEPGTVPGNGVGHGNAQHASNAAAAKASAAVELAEPGIVPGNGVGRGNAQHVSNAAAAKASEATELAEPGTVPGNGVGHGNAQHASHAAAAKASAAAELAEPGIMPGNGVGHGNAQHVSNPAVAKASAAAELMVPGVAPGHSNSEHPSHSASASATGAVEAIETSFAHGNSHGTAQHVSNPAAAKASAVAELTEAGIPAGHSNSQHGSHSVSPSAMGSAEPDETGIAPGNGGGNGNSPQASQSTAANASATAPPAEPASWTSGAGHEPAFHFKATPSTPTAAVELEDPNAPVLLGHGAELVAILEVGPAAIEGHAASHLNNGQHHAAGHLPHELLP